MSEPTDGKTPRPAQSRALGWHVARGCVGIAVKPLFAAPAGTPACCDALSPAIRGHVVRTTRPRALGIGLSTGKGRTVSVPEVGSGVPRLWLRDPHRAGRGYDKAGGAGRTAFSCLSLFVAMPLHPDARDPCIALPEHRFILQRPDIAVDYAIRQVSAPSRCVFNDQHRNCRRASFRTRAAGLVMGVPALVSRSRW